MCRDTEDKIQTHYTKFGEHTQYLMNVKRYAAKYITDADVGLFGIYELRCRFNDVLVSIIADTRAAYNNDPSFMQEAFETSCDFIYDQFMKHISKNPNELHPDWYKLRDCPDLRNIIAEILSHLPDILDGI